MQYKPLFFAIFALLLAPRGGFSQGIAFEHGSFAEALQMAKSQNKLLFIDAYTDWCGPCRWMAANTFTDGEVGEFFNRNFVSFKYNMEKGDGPQFARNYGVRAYPTLFFLDGDGNIVIQETGARDASGLLELGRSAQAKMPASGGETGMGFDEEPGYGDGIDILESALQTGDGASFITGGEMLLSSDLVDREHIFLNLQEAYFLQHRDTALFVENIFFWAESTELEDAAAHELAASLYADHVRDPSLLDFAELWAMEAVELSPGKQNLKTLARVRALQGASVTTELPEEEFMPEDEFEQDFVGEEVETNWEREAPPSEEVLPPVRENRPFPVDPIPGGTPKGEVSPF